MGAEHTINGSRERCEERTGGEGKTPLLLLREVCNLSPRVGGKKGKEEEKEERNWWGREGGRGKRFLSLNKGFSVKKGFCEKREGGGTQIS